MLIPPVLHNLFHTISHRWSSVNCWPLPLLTMCTQNCVPKIVYKLLPFQLCHLLEGYPRSHAWFMSSVILKWLINTHRLNGSTSPLCFSSKENPVTRCHHFYHSSRGRTPSFHRNRRITDLSCQLHRFQRDSHCNLSLWSCPGHCLSIVSRRGKYFCP